MISIASLRKFIENLFSGNEELDAFCHDNYPIIYREFSTGASRTTKLTRLLQRTDHSELLTKLRPYIPTAKLKEYQHLVAQLTQVRPQDHKPTLLLNLNRPPPNSRIHRLLGGWVVTVLSALFLSLLSPAIRNMLVRHPTLLGGVAVCVVGGIIYLLSFLNYRLALYRHAKDERRYLNYQQVYLDKLRSTEAAINTRGLLTRGHNNPSLAQVFVELQISAESPVRASPVPFGTQGPTKSRSIFAWLNHKDISDPKDPKYPTLVMLGPPGSGKTTLLEHVARILVEQRQAESSLPSIWVLPLLIYLRDHATWTTEANVLPQSLGELASPQIFFGRSSSDLNLPVDFFELALNRGHCLVLLDGFDEVGDLHQRARLRDWLEAQIKRYHRCRFIITSRPGGYRDAPITKITPLIVLEPKPLNWTQIQNFVERFYLAEERAVSIEKSSQEVEQFAKACSASLLDGLKRGAHLLDLANNPLLLTMIVLVHKYRKELPVSRVLLYKEICEVLIEEWQKGKDLRVPLNRELALALLEPLASCMMHEHLRDLTTGRIIQLVESLPEVSAKIKAGGIQFSKQILYTFQEYGLLLERENDLWAFAHLSLQEYLTACHLRRHESKDGSNLPDVSDPWWNESMRLYAALHDATQLITKCLNVGTVQSLILAADCIDEGVEIKPDVLKAAETRLLHALESSDVQLRQMAARITLMRRLRGLRGDGRSSVIDSAHIVNAEYQLFIDECQLSQEYEQPEYWREMLFPIGQAREPVRGMSPASALKFCNWLTKRFGNSTAASYRLPNEFEVADVRPQHSTPSPIATWYQDGKRLSHESKHLDLGWANNQSLLDTKEAIHIDTYTNNAGNLNFSAIRNDDIILLFGDAKLDCSFLIRWAKCLNLNKLLISRVEFNEYVDLNVSDAMHNETKVLLRIIYEIAKMLGLSSRISVRVRTYHFMLEHFSSIIKSYHWSPEIELLDSLLELMSAMQPINQRFAVRKFLWYLMQNALRSTGKITGAFSLGLHTEAGHANPLPDQYVGLMLDIYFYCSIQMAREQGEGPLAWEGLRIVREPSR